MQEYSDKFLDIYESLDIRDKDDKKKVYDGMKQHYSPVNWMEMKPVVESAIVAWKCKWNHKGKTSYGDDGILFG